MSKLPNDIKLKIDALFNKTGLDIELIEERASREDFYYYKLKLHPISLYVDTNSGLKFADKFWHELKKILNNGNLNIYFDAGKRLFAIVENEVLTVGRYISDMEFYDGVSRNMTYSFLSETNERVVVFNDLGATSVLQKDKFSIIK